MTCRLAFLFAALLVVGAAVTWSATGREGYTRWPNAKLEQADVAPSPEEDALLAEIGFDDGAAGPASSPDVRSRFAFGLLPGGFDLAHLPSVATAGALAVGLVLISSIGAAATRRRAATPPPSLTGPTP